MRARAWIVWAAVIAGACAPKGQPTLDISLTPKTVTDGTPVQVKVIATAGDGKIGTGTVKISSAAGSLVSPAEVPLDSFGTATAEFICDPTTEPECAPSVRVVAEWTSDGVSSSAEARLSSGAGGGGGATGGGTGGGGGSFQPGAGKVMLLGFLTGESQDCLKRGLVDPRTPQAVQVSFGCYMHEQSAILYNNEVYYTESGKPGIRKFRADTWGFVNGVSVLPSPDENPDIAILEECGTIQYFQISNTGRILHDCQGWGIS